MAHSKDCICCDCSTAEEISEAVHDAVVANKRTNKPYSVVYIQSMGAAVSMPYAPDLAQYGYCVIMTVGNIIKSKVIPFRLK